MKILHINALCGIGSTGMIVKNLKNACIQNGIKCYVACQFSDPAHKVDYKIGSKMESLIHAILARIAGKQAYYSSFATWRLLHYIDKIQPDIVHLHNLHNNYININILLRYLAKKGIKSVITLHDCWWYTGGCYHYTSIKCDKWLTSCDHCPKRWEETPAYLYDASHKIFNDRKKYLSAISNLTLVGVSNWISEEASKSFLKIKNIRTIYNGLDLRVFKKSDSTVIRERFGVENKYVLLGPASKWLSEINKPVLSYFKKNLKPNMVLFLMGYTGNKQSLDSQIFFIPYVENRADLVEIYSMADVFVNCTREESLGLLNIEAQLCGTPVVSFSNTGAKETVPESNLVDDGNYEDLFNKALKPTKPRADFLKRFDAERMYESYLSLYQTL